MCVIHCWMNLIYAFIAGFGICCSCIVLILYLDTKKVYPGPSLKEEIKQIERICSLEEAQIEWKERKNATARRLLEPYKTSGLKWFLAYYLTWFPYRWFQVLQKLRGAVQPV